MIAIKRDRSERVIPQVCVSVRRLQYLRPITAAFFQGAEKELLLCAQLDDLRHPIYAESAAAAITFIAAISDT